MRGCTDFSVGLICKDLHVIVFILPFFFFFFVIHTVCPILYSKLLLVQEFFDIQYNCMSKVNMCLQIKLKTYKSILILKKYISSVLNVNFLVYR